MRGSPYHVIVCDLFNLHDPDHETVVVGFPTRELAIEYARRRTWSSVDQMREQNLSREQVRNRWLALGEDCRVVGAEGVVYMARAELEAFLEHPLPPERRDWVSLYRSLLPDDFALTYEWATGSMPPPHHYEYTITVTPTDSGHILFWPDYPSHTCPQWEEAFAPHLPSRILLYNWMQTSGLFIRPQEVPAEPVMGGETGYLKMSAGGKRAHLAAHLFPHEEYVAVHHVIRALVPDILWKELAARRQQYIASTYPKAGE